MSAPALVDATLRSEMKRDGTMEDERKSGGFGGGQRQR